MSLTPKNWKTFQHYSDRKPAWIKLHRGLLDDFAYASLPLASRALAPLLWLLASEYKDGSITASLQEIAFRVHTTVDDLVDAINPLVNAGLFIDDSGVLAPRKQSDCLEKEIEEETQVEKEEEDSRSLRSRECDVSHSILDDDWPEDYQERFWKQYPRKIGRKTAFAKLKALRKTGEVTFARLMAGVAKIPIGEARFIPHPITWLNQGRWDDEVSTELPLSGVKNGKSTPSERAYELASKARELELAKGIGRSPDVVGSDDDSGRFAKPISQH